MGIFGLPLALQPFLRGLIRVIPEGGMDSKGGQGSFFLRSNADQASKIVLDYYSPFDQRGHDQRQHSYFRVRCSTNACIRMCAARVYENRACVQYVLVGLVCRTLPSISETLIKEQSREHHECRQATSICKETI